MEENKITVGQVSVKYGLFSGVAGVGYFILLNLMEQGMNQVLGYIGYIILAAFVFIAHKTFKDDGDGYMNYGQGLGIGTLISLIHGALGGIFFYVYVSFINKGYMQLIFDKQREGMEEQGMDDAQIEQALEMTSKFMSPGLMVVFSILGTVFFGFIISLIVSAITQNKRPETDLI